MKVRAGIHRGRPTLTDTGYVGLAVHTVARICQAGHGAQTLLTGPARDALARARPAGVRFQSLGRHRFHGLRELQPVYQVEAAGLPARFPPLRSSGAPDRR